MSSRTPGVVVAAALAVAAVVAIFAGCGSPPGLSSLPGPSSAPAASPAASSASAPSSVEPPVPDPSPAGTASVLPDPDLFEVLPETDDLFERTYDPVTSAAVAADPSLDPAVDTLATGLYRLRDAAPDSPDFAIVNVVHLRGPQTDENWFRSWRDTYDAAACAQAGGVVRRSETAVRDLTIYVGSCAGGAFTYHAVLNEGNVILSMTSVGPARIGQAVVERLGR